MKTLIFKRFTALLVTSSFLSSVVFPSYSRELVPFVELPHKFLIRPDLSMGPEGGWTQKFLDRLPKLGGSVRRVSGDVSGASPIVVHILDVHRHFEAQQHIGNIVTELANDGAGLLALEGTQGKIDLDAFRASFDRKTITTVADYLLREQRISGPIHHLLIAPSKLSIVGIDDPSHHAANVRAYQQASFFSKDLSRNLMRYRFQLTHLKKAQFNPLLWEFDKKVQAFRSHHLKLGDYVRTLALQSKNCGVAIPVTVNNFLDSYQLERQIDWASAEKERLIVIDRATTRQKIITSRYPQFLAYMRYVSLVEHLDTELLFQELDQLEQRIYSELAVDSYEKSLIQRDRISFLEYKLLHFSLSPYEWSENKKAIAARASSDNRFGHFADFYSEAEARDTAMAANLLKAIPQTKSNLYVLVTGGFHAVGIDKRLEQAGYTVVDVVPQISKVNTLQGTAYLSEFARAKTPLDQFLEGQPLFLAGAPAISLEAFRILCKAVASDTEDKESHALVKPLVWKGVFTQMQLVFEANHKLAQVFIQPTTRTFAKLVATSIMLIVLPGCVSGDVNNSVFLMASAATIFLIVSMMTPHNGKQLRNNEASSFLVDEEYKKPSGIVLRKALHDFGQTLATSVEQLKFHHVLRVGVFSPIYDLMDFIWTSSPALSSMSFMEILLKEAGFVTTLNEFENSIEMIEAFLSTTSLAKELVLQEDEPQPWLLTRQSLVLRLSGARIRRVREFDLSYVSELFFQEVVRLGDSATWMPQRFQQLRIEYMRDHPDLLKMLEKRFPEGNLLLDILLGKTINEKKDGEPGRRYATFPAGYLTVCSYPETSGRNPKVVLYDMTPDENGVPRCERLREMQSVMSDVTEIMFRNDGTQLAGVKKNSTLVIWDVQSGKLLSERSIILPMQDPAHLWDRDDETYFEQERVAGPFHIPVFSDESVPAYVGQDGLSLIKITPTGRTPQLPNFPTDIRFRGLPKSTESIFVNQFQSEGDTVVDFWFVADQHRITKRFRRSAGTTQFVETTSLTDEEAMVTEPVSPSDLPDLNSFIKSSQQFFSRDEVLSLAGLAKSADGAILLDRLLDHYILTTDINGHIPRSDVALLLRSLNAIRGKTVSITLLARRLQNKWDRISGDGKEMLPIQNLLARNINLYVQSVDGMIPRWAGVYWLMEQRLYSALSAEDGVVSADAGLASIGWAKHYTNTEFCRRFPAILDDGSRLFMIKGNELIIGKAGIRKWKNMHDREVAIRAASREAEFVRLDQALDELNWVWRKWTTLVFSSIPMLESWKKIQSRSAELIGPWIYILKTELPTIVRVLSNQPVRHYLHARRRELLTTSILASVFPDRYQPYISIKAQRAMANSAELRYAVFKLIDVWLARKGEDKLAIQQLVDSLFFGPTSSEIPRIRKSPAVSSQSRPSVVVDSPIESSGKFSDEAWQITLQNVVDNLVDLLESRSDIQVADLNRLVSTWRRISEKTLSYDRPQVMATLCAAEKLSAGRAADFLAVFEQTKFGGLEGTNFVMLDDLNRAVNKVLTDLEHLPVSSESTPSEFLLPDHFQGYLQGYPVDILSPVEATTLLNLIKQLRGEDQLVPMWEDPEQPVSVSEIFKLLTDSSDGSSWRLGVAWSDSIPRLFVTHLETSIERHTLPHPEDQSVWAAPLYRFLSRADAQDSIADETPGIWLNELLWPEESIADGAPGESDKAIDPLPDVKSLLYGHSDAEQGIYVFGPQQSLELLGAIASVMPNVSIPVEGGQTEIHVLEVLRQHRRVMISEDTTPHVMVTSRPRTAEKIRLPDDSLRVQAFRVLKVVRQEGSARGLSRFVNKLFPQNNDNLRETAKRAVESYDLDSLLPLSDPRRSRQTYPVKLEFDRAFSERRQRAAGS